MHNQIIKINKNYKKERNTKKNISRQKCTYMKQIKQEKDKKKKLRKKTQIEIVGICKILENNVHT